MEDPDKTSKSCPRRPWLAGLLSLLTPGLGHLYTGRPIAAVIALLLVIVSLNLAIAILVYLNLGWFNPLLAVLLPLMAYLGVTTASVAAAKRTEHDYTLRGYNAVWLYGLVILAFMFFGPRLTQVWGTFKGYSVPSSAMENTIQIGDYILADHNAYNNRGPAPNDIVVFIFPGDGVTEYVKRCVAGPSDTVEVRDKQLYVNGRLIPDPEAAIHIDTLADGGQNIQQRRPGGASSRDNFGPFVVPADSYFMLGDNRDNSYDSRFWGAVPRKLILAQTVRLYWSAELSRIGMPVK